MSYSRINFEDEVTKLNAANLNKIDEIIYDYLNEFDAANKLPKLDANAYLLLAQIIGNVPALDSNGKLILTGSSQIGTKATDLAELWDKTTKIIAGDIGAGAITGDKLIAGAEAAHMYPKVVSDNLRHSHDAQLNKNNEAEYILMKTYTFAKGISGTLRVKFDLQETHYYDEDPELAYGKIYKNGEPIGTEQSCYSDWTTFSEDIDFGSLGPNDTIELWGKCLESATRWVKVRNFRIYYDNDTKPIAVEGVSNS